ncbi:hypothetical protein LX32DRAFT_354407 [Colletotrichum zoysiae]|uniref:Secreted protein n=1 Tax=Colletotrichum zoysiae TaxID=1216348 RepID=A0AAD9HJJ9_9PEZI|nr:hypothetical protein LX32DRAFT_354407 [Colletotrichum zoysiae]
MPGRLLRWVAGIAWSIRSMSCVGGTVKAAPHLDPASDGLSRLTTAIDPRPAAFRLRTHFHTTPALRFTAANLSFPGCSCQESKRSRMSARQVQRQPRPALWPVTSV